MHKIEYLTRTKVASIMRRLNFFNAFSELEIESLTEFHTHFFVYEKNERIIEEGALNTSFFILLSGSVSVIKNNAKRPLARLEAGEFFGEIAFLTGIPRTSTVIAEETSIAIKVNQGMLGKLSSGVREKIKDQIIASLIYRLLKMNAGLLS